MCIYKESVKIWPKRHQIVVTICNIYFCPPPEVDDNNVAVTESNGDAVLEPDSGEIWPAEMDTVLAESPSPPGLEDKAGLGAPDPAQDIYMPEERPVDDGLDEQPPEEKHNCDRLSPQSVLDDPYADPVALPTIFIAPLDASQAELRSQVIKEVRKPGRSESVHVHRYPNPPFDLLFTSRVVLFVFRL